jgi:hypothetical protein
MDCYKHFFYNNISSYVGKTAGIALSVANVAIFFLDWRLKSASGDFFGAY